MTPSSDELVFVPLGGLGEIGMNAALYGFGPPKQRKWILVDCGMGFGSEELLPGIDLVYPDLSFIEERRENLLGIFITHAHEDHIGALVELWPRLKARPPYGRLEARPDALSR
jgi:ribonuclease J